MDVGLAKRIENNVDRAASALLAGAVGYAAFVYFGMATTEPQLGALTGGAAAVAYVISVRALKAAGPPRPRYPVPIFDLRKIDPAPIDDLLLTDADRLPVEPAASADALVLDDILAEIGPGSRVVRLFDPSAMPTPGQLKARIDRHLDQEDGRGTQPDASEALHEALAELRRSLR